MFFLVYLKMSYFSFDALRVAYNIGTVPDLGGREIIFERLHRARRTQEREQLSGKKRYSQRST